MASRTSPVVARGPSLDPLSSLTAERVRLEVAALEAIAKGVVKARLARLEATLMSETVSDQGHVQRWQLDLPVYWINLQAQQGRRKAMQAALPARTATRVPAVSVREVRQMLGGGALSLGSDLVDALTADEPYLRHPRNQVILAEVACTLSHLRAMRSAVLDNVGVALILEDDMNVSWLPRRLPGPLSELAHRAPVDWDILQLHMLNSAMYRRLCARPAAFVPWEKDFWSTGAYLITNAAMRRILAATTRRTATWLPAPVVADHLLYILARTYTLARPALATARVPWRVDGTTIQQRHPAKTLADGERALWAGMGPDASQCRLAPRAPAAAAQATLLVLVTAHVHEQHIQRRNAHAVAAAFGANAILAIVCPDRRCDAWTDFRAEVGRTLGLRTALVNDAYAWHGMAKFLAQVDAFKMVSSYSPWLQHVFVMDGDIDLDRPTFHLARFVARASGTMLVQPAVDVSVPKFPWGGQWFPPLNALYWRRRSQAQASPRGLCAVPFVEEQVFLADARFFAWFVDHRELQGLYDRLFLERSEWGHDLLWCRAAREYNASATACAVAIDEEVYHVNTSTIVKDARYKRASLRMKDVLRRHRWYVDVRQAQREWVRPNQRHVCMDRFSPRTAGRGRSARREGPGGESPG